MKRLCARPSCRNLGLGRQLAEAALHAARREGHACFLRDTLREMEPARPLHEDLGLEGIPPCYHKPIPGAHYLKVKL